MPSGGYDILEVLKSVDPAVLSYTEWLNVGMALKAEGYASNDWEEWSLRDPARYHMGECDKKWDTFTSSGIGGGTIVQYAREQGWEPERRERASEAFSWDATIGGKDALKIVDSAWVEESSIDAPSVWNPAQQLIRYLELLFQTEDNVGYVTKAYYSESKDKYLPTQGCCDRTAGELITALRKWNDIGQVLGDYEVTCGAWIRFNPLDGKGVKNENVTEFRYALVESDAMSVEQQYSLIKALELPVAVLVHSGGKSLHAIVHIDAANYEEYRKRVDFLYEVCKKNGLKLDQQNRNPSRLSRMPGVLRGENRQYIVAENIGYASFNEWKEFVEAANDDLPEPESLGLALENVPPLKPALIDGILREGHKMLLSGPSKAGKSYALIELCIAIAEGQHWLGWPCRQGKVFYVNLELDPASCINRFNEVYNALGFPRNHPDCIDVWNLRGKSKPLDQLLPALLRRCVKRGYKAVIIDPIYKVITGDENAADQMSKFCNCFDCIASELGCAVIYCHHHSKGAQGGKKSMDRASGSGVFARDPDALIDLTELSVDEKMRDNTENRVGCQSVAESLDRLCPKWRETASYGAMSSFPQMIDLARVCGLSEALVNTIMRKAHAAQEKANRRTAWRIEGTLREFPSFPAKNVWFEHPIHVPDDAGELKDAEFEGGQAPWWQDNFEKKKSPDEAKESRVNGIEIAFEACAENGRATLGALAESLGCSPKTVRNRAKEHGGFWVDGGVVTRKTEGAEGWT